MLLPEDLLYEPKSGEVLGIDTAGSDQKRLIVNGNDGRLEVKHAGHGHGNNSQSINRSVFGELADAFVVGSGGTADVDSRAHAQYVTAIDGARLRDEADSDEWFESSGDGPRLSAPLRRPRSVDDGDAVQHHSGVFDEGAVGVLLVGIDDLHCVSGCSQELPIPLMLLPGARNIDLRTLPHHERLGKRIGYGTDQGYRIHARSVRESPRNVGSHARCGVLPSAPH